jgi:ABC-2 type transport system permease protein
MTGVAGSYAKYGGQEFSVLLLESKYEVLKLWRLPSFVLPTILFPVMFYILFGVVLASTFHVSGIAAKIMIANFGTMAIMATSLFGFGVRVAVERGQGWLELKRVSPVPVATYFAAKFSASLTFALGAIVILLILGNTLGRGHLGVEQILLLSAVLLLGCIPFSALGLAVGYFAEASAAPAIVNAIMWPLAFLSGLWIPLYLLPASLQRIASVLPAYQLDQLAVRAVGAPHIGREWGYVLALAGFTFCCLAVAAIRFRGDEQ